MFHFIFKYFVLILYFIVFNSICNASGCQETNDSMVGNLTLLFKSIIQKYDGIYNNDNKWGYNRPVSGAMNEEWGNYMSKYLDIQGVNYYYDELSNYHNLYPNQSIISSESCCCLNDRNEYCITNKWSLFYIWWLSMVSKCYMSKRLLDTNCKSIFCIWFI